MFSLVDGETETLNGCGGDPAMLLQAGEWVVEDLDGAGIIDRSRVTLNFGAGGRISGRASCNHYTGQRKLTGEGLTISSKTAMTMMACAPAVMTQESKFIDLLTTTIGFTISPDGALVLLAGDRRIITARRGVGGRALTHERRRDPRSRRRCRDQARGISPAAAAAGPRTRRTHPRTR